MRKQPEVSPPEAIIPKQPDNVITQVREYQLITPLYGGGVNPTEADPITVVRATEIRGHLRFWWRGCRGGQQKFDGRLEKMRKEEEDIWGKAYKKGEDSIPHKETIQITIDMDSLNKGKSLKPFKIVEKPAKHGKGVGRQPKPDNDIPSYAAFPLQPDQEQLKKEKPHMHEVRSNVSFTMTISFPKKRCKDVEAALWAWETFGGIGARTRRGFGALRCTSIQEDGQPIAVELAQANQAQTRKWIQQKLAEHVVVGSWAASIPHLQQKDAAFKVVDSEDAYDGWIAWKYLIDKLKKFRQMRFASTRPNANSPGRSMWPEPSAIRHLTDQSLPAHANPIPDPVIEKFPRAAFGLPIIFQFKDRNKDYHDDSSKDPRKTILQLKDSERFSSPLILKPLACQDGLYIGLALVLAGTKAEDKQLFLKTQEGKEEKWNVEAALSAKESLTIGTGSPILINSRIDALQAFLQYL